MLKLIAILSLSLCLLAGAACSGEPAKEAPPASPPAPLPKIVYGPGFHDEERSEGGQTFRWMEPDAVVRLKNTGRDMVLVIAGNAPVHVFKGPSTIKLSFNGAPLDQFTGTAETTEKRYEIATAQLGSGTHSELRITSDKSMVPKEVDKNLQDGRRMAFTLTKLSWEEK